MPVVNVKRGGGWGCTCKAHSIHYKPLDGLVRSVDCQARIVRREFDGSVVFEAWTNPADIHTVVYSPSGQGGFCKHIPACAALLLGEWLTEAAKAAKELRDKSDALTKEAKKLRKEIEKCSSS